MSLTGFCKEYGDFSLCLGDFRKKLATFPNLPSPLPNYPRSLISFSTDFTLSLVMHQLQLFTGTRDVIICPFWRCVPNSPSGYSLKAPSRKQPLRLIPRILIQRRYTEPGADRSFGPWIGALRSYGPARPSIRDLRY